MDGRMMDGHAACVECKLNIHKQYMNALIHSGVKTNEVLMSESFNHSLKRFIQTQKSVQEMSII